MNALHINSEYRTDVTFIDWILVLPNILFCSLMDTDCTDPWFWKWQSNTSQQLYVLPQATRLEAAEMNRQWQERFLPVLATWSKIVWGNIILQMSFQAKQGFFECNLTIFVDAILFCLFRKSMIFVPMGSVSPVGWNDLRTQHDMSFKQLCNFQHRGQVDLRKTGVFSSKKEHG